MPRAWLWLQLVIGWLPVWVLFIVLILTAHQSLELWGAVVIATRMVVAGAALGPLVQRVVHRLKWPQPMRAGFVARHVVAAAAYSGTWFLLNSVIDSLFRGQAVLVIGFMLGSYLIMGIWLYVMTAGVLYAADATTRAARAEVVAAQSQLAALRGQLNPHFLFNALHTVVQLAPRAPNQAARAAEDLAALLRTSMEETRDLLPLADEWRFVERYLDVERIRFGDRLKVVSHLPPETLMAWVPSFAVQTLVENAVRHGAAPQVDATTIRIDARLSGARLELIVEDDGAGAPDAVLAGEAGAGTGLKRLRERLQVLLGAEARLMLVSGARGVRATLIVPQLDV